MIKIKAPQPTLRTVYLNHKAFYDSSKKRWYINEEELTDEDLIFFFAKGEPVEMTNIHLMFYLSTHSFFTLNEHLQVDIVKSLSMPREIERDMDIPFSDFARITELFQYIEEDAFYDKCQKALLTSDYDKDDTLTELGMNELERALFYYCFYK